MIRSARLTFIFAVLAQALLSQSNILLDPPVFKSEGHQLDILMVAKAKPISLAGLHPTAWVYEVCLRKEAFGNWCPARNATAAPYGGVRLALQPGDHLKIRLINQLPPAPADAEHVQ